MKVVILAGGYGTRISEESQSIPKPMVKIGEFPILWHIMKLYSYYGFNDFIICAGYKQHIIKEWFINYYSYFTDITCDYSANNKIIYHTNNSIPWKVTIIDTKLNTMTGGRIKRIQRFTENEPFLLTYGDGVSDVNIMDLVSFHKQRGKIATLTAVRPTGRFGTLDIADNKVTQFREKSSNDVGWINGGFMVLEPQIFDYLIDDTTILERAPLETLARDGQLASYKHYGFWKCMDTLKDKNDLIDLWNHEPAPWKIWNE